MEASLYMKAGHSLPVGDQLTPTLLFSCHRAWAGKGGKEFQNNQFLKQEKGSKTSPVCSKGYLVFFFSWILPNSRKSDFFPFCLVYAREQKKGKNKSQKLRRKMVNGD